VVAFFVVVTMQALLGQKTRQTQMFLIDGTRIPVSFINVAGNVVTDVKTKEKNGYNALQLGIGKTKRLTKAMDGLAKAAKIEHWPYFVREIRVYSSDSAPSAPPPGTIINPTEVLKAGDIVDVTGISKGKGYAGVVKRHHFKGGPRTHGQSDRERAPGSIGQTTTPGRVYKGKRMAGRMGHERVTVKNLEVVDVGQDYVAVKGLVPGPINSFLILKKRGEDKKFVPMYKEVPKIEEKKMEVKDAS